MLLICLEQLGQMRGTEVDERGWIDDSVTPT
jgi:hypothetical protein